MKNCPKYLSAFSTLLISLSILLGFSACGGGSDEAEIRQAIANGQSFLESIQRADGAISDTTNPLFDVWETVLATEALIDSVADQEKSSVQKALKFLQASENPQKLLCHNRKCSQAICLETSAEYVLLLSKIQPGMDFSGRLDTVVRSQNPDGSWDILNPDVKEAPNFPSVTGFVLSMLAAADLKAMNQDSARIWLLESQNDEGHWGVSWEYYGCPAYALWPVLRALASFDDPSAKAAISNAHKYISSQQKVDGSWYFEGDGMRKMPSAELQTALMLNALLDSKIESKVTFSFSKKAISFLLALQKPNGAWDGGEFPTGSARYIKQEYVVATALTILALQKYLR